MADSATHSFRDTIAHHSKSFSFASRLIPKEERTHVEVLYCWCREVDDAIDFAGSEAHHETLIRLREGVDAIYSRSHTDEPTLAAMQEVVREFEMPRVYLDDLLDGMEMDASGQVYDDLDTLLLYCYRVAGTVGLMMSHILGVRAPGALQHAVHLGIAMQITNICRDVQEDWGRGRLYVPSEILAHHGALSGQMGHPLTRGDVSVLSKSIEQLLDLADVYYHAADRGMPYLAWQPALSVRAARLIYSEIGSVLRRNNCDVLSGRAYVPRGRKIWLAARAIARTLCEIPFRTTNRFARAPLRAPLRYPADILLP
jgi:15-cis-phytoene synthase